LAAGVTQQSHQPSYSDEKAVAAAVEVKAAVHDMLPPLLAAPPPPVPAVPPLLVPPVPPPAVPPAGCAPVPPVTPPAGCAPVPLVVPPAPSVLPLPPVPPLHTPAMHDCPLAQADPQAPQFSALEEVSTQSAPHSVPAGHTQLPSTQASPLAQAWPHCPQFRTLELTSTQLRSQTTSPASHSVLHTPDEQTSPVAQATPQPPQLAGSLVMSTHPFVHDSSPELHAQAPAMQVVPVGQTVPQLPQLAESLVRSRHVPEQSVASAGHGSGVGRLGGVGEQAATGGRRPQQIRAKDRENRMFDILPRHPAWGCPNPPCCWSGKASDEPGSTS
jgi:hypothetical protein